MNKIYNRDVASFSWVNCHSPIFEGNIRNIPLIHIAVAPLHTHLGVMRQADPFLVACRPHLPVEWEGSVVHRTP